MIRIAKLTCKFPRSNLAFVDPVAHGKPFGNALERHGGGPESFDQTILEYELHGGVIMMTSNCPADTLPSQRSWFVESSRSSKGFVSKSTSSTVTSSTSYLVLRYRSHSAMEALRSSPEYKYNARRTPSLGFQLAIRSRRSVLLSNVGFCQAVGLEALRTAGGHSAPSKPEPGVQFLH